MFYSNLTNQMKNSKNGLCGSFQWWDKWTGGLREDGWLPEQSLNDADGERLSLSGEVMGQFGSQHPQDEMRSPGWELWTFDGGHLEQDDQWSDPVKGSSLVSHPWRIYLMLRSLQQWFLLFNVSQNCTSVGQYPPKITQNILHTI